jgi:hypothetical protein
MEMVVEGFDGVDDEFAKFVSEVLPDVLVSAGDFGHESGMAVFPVVEGFAVDLEGLADVLIALAGEEAIEGVLLF